MFGILDAIKMGAAAIVAGLIVWQVATRVGEGRGYDRAKAEQAAANYKAELERKRDNETLRNMSNYDLCVSDLSSRGLPIDPCQQLRGL